MKHNRIMTGMLAAIMVAGTSFYGYADAADQVVVGVAPEMAETAETGEDAGTVGTEPAATAGEENSGTVTAGTGTVTAGTGTVTAGSGTVTAGSGTVTAGSGTVTAGSGVITAGSGMPAIGSMGPGIQGGENDSEEAAALQELPNRIDYFQEQVPNPIVKPVEKYSYDQMCQDLNSLASRYGNLMQTNVIGTSLDGRNIYEVIVGNANAEKHILIHAGIHAREYMTPLLVMKQMEYGLEFYSRGNYDGKALSDIMQQVAIHYVPMVNPDGISLSQFGITAIRSGELRQAIEQCYADDTAQGRTSAAFDRYLMYWKANARGVDLNQNFPADWEQVASCPNPSYGTYRGTQPLSEPESQALANLAESRTWKATISYHSMGNIIYWDYPGSQVSQWSQELSNLVAASTGYRPAGSSGHGGFKDWTQIKDNPITGLTIEVGSVACPMPLSEWDDVWYRNKMVWAAVAKYAMEH